MSLHVGYLINSRTLDIHNLHNIHNAEYINTASEQKKQLKKN